VSTQPPYLSIVVASRNDQHGGNILKRMRLFLQGLLAQSRQYCFPVELIFVEWNPPGDRPRLRDVLPRPSEHDYLTLRYVEVPAAVHARYRRAREIPLFQMIAKNVGIRRARGAFILCTNIDLLFSDALFRTLAEKRLRSDSYYRANRCDVPDSIDPAWDLPEQQTWCERNVIRRLGRDPRYKNVSLELVGLRDASPLKKWLFNQLMPGMSFFWPPEKRAFYQLDSFACGDFTLMSREAWEAIGGYLELDLYSLHIDSIGIIAARALGYRQHVFPPKSCTYHIDHPSGWESMSPLEKLRFLEERPAIDYSLVYDFGLHVLKSQQTLNLNSANWGYADLDLEEFSFPPAAGPAARTVVRAALSG
jgi:hypothetical protein